MGIEESSPSGGAPKRGGWVRSAESNIRATTHNEECQCELGSAEMGYRAQNEIEEC
jgi:hypothetical protein